MEIKGKLLEVLEAREGEGKNGKWKRQDFIIETLEEYARKICISNWNDKVPLESLNPGTQLTASVNIESREYNGRWYTDIKVWKMETTGSEPKDDLPPPEMYTDKDVPQEDDLPF